MQYFLLVDETELCDFEDGHNLCGYTQSEDNPVQFESIAGAEFPISDHTLQSQQGHVLVANVTAEGSKAEIFSPQYANSGTVCLHAYYIQRTKSNVVIQVRASWEISWCDRRIFSHIAIVFQICSSSAGVNQCSDVSVKGDDETWQLVQRPILPEGENWQVRNCYVRLREAGNPWKEL